MVSTYTIATSTCSSYTSQRPRVEKGQPPRNRLATPGARSTASAGTKDSAWHKIKEMLSEKHGMRHVRKTGCLCCGLAGHNCKECRKRPNKEPMMTAAEGMQLQQPVGITRSKEQTMQKPQVAIREPLDANLVFVKLHGHSALALIDLQLSAATLSGDNLCTCISYQQSKLKPRLWRQVSKGLREPLTRPVKWY